jgi:putative ABC transport system substrate-binding protein
MRLRWVMLCLGAVALAVVAGVLHVGDFFQDRMMVIGVLNHGKIAERSLEGFKAGLADLGFSGEKRVRFIYQGPLQGGALEQEARRLVSLKPDMLLALSTPAAKAGREAARDTGIPLVFAPASDPVGSGLANSLAKPGRNATGVTFGVQEPVRFHWMKTIVPTIQTVLVPYNPDDISPRLSVERVKPVAQELGITLVLRHVRSVADLEQVMGEIPPGIDAIFVPTDALVASNLPLILNASAGRHIPVSAVDRSSVQAGALMSYGLDLNALGRQAARLAVQIMAGIPAGDLPVETAEFRLSINLETAQRLNIRIGDNILRQAEIFRATEARDAR